jgi:hypothetical protein
MFQLMRNIHLGLGLAFVVMALMFALSSLFVIYKPWFPDEATETERTVQLAADAAKTPRSLALELIRNHGLKGDVIGIERDAETFHFRVFRPGTEHVVDYVRATGEVRIQEKRWQLGQTLLQLHTTHGFWHDSIPQSIWAGLSLLTSIALLLLGASGVYLWFAHHKERFIGSVLLAVGLSYGIITLVLTRLDS